MPKVKLEEFLLPWEQDKDGKKLEEPAEIDVERLRKYVYGLLSDKETAQAARDDAIGLKDGVQNELDELRKQNETADQKRERENAEAQAELDRLRKGETERRKVEAIEEAFKADGITLDRAKRLAKRIGDVDEKDWISEAKELVEDGFIIKPKSEKPEGENEDPDGDDPPEELVPVRRSTRGGRVVVAEDSTKKKKSVGDELDAAGITLPGWS